MDGPPRGQVGVGIGGYRWKTGHKTFITQHDEPSDTESAETLETYVAMMEDMELSKVSCEDRVDEWYGDIPDTPAPIENSLIGQPGRKPRKATATFPKAARKPHPKHF